MFCLLVCCLMLGVFSFCPMCVFEALFKLASQGKEVEILEAGEASSAAPASAAPAKRFSGPRAAAARSRACKKLSWRLRRRAVAKMNWSSQTMRKKRLKQQQDYLHKYKQGLMFWSQTPPHLPILSLAYCKQQY